MLCTQEEDQMIIAIDGYEANQRNRVGIGRYAYEILCHIYMLAASSDPRFKFRIYLPGSPLPDMPKETSWWQYRVIPMRRLWTYIGLPFGLLSGYPKADVVFSPTHYIPRFTSGIPSVMSVMDVSYLQYPELFRKKDLLQLTRGTAYSVSHARHIVTISRFSKNAIIQAYGTSEKKISITYPGRTMKNNAKNNARVDLKSLYHIDKPYILAVGTLQPRKNFEKLIEAFALLKKTGLKEKDLELVVVGKKGWLYEGIVSAPEKYGVSDSVRFLDFVPDSDLPSLYTHAVCFALPSLYEGFGLPVLEAMALGCPVVVSNVSSIPEIAGNAGIYVDPNDVASIRDGLMKALSEKGTTKETERVKKGQVQAKKFTWEKAASETLRVLTDVGKGKKV